MDPASGEAPEVMSASALIGEAVVNARGEEAGHIEEIMVDLESGQLAYVVVSLTLPGLGDRFFALPWKRLQRHPDQGYLVFDVDPERLQKAPGFDKSHWPAMGDLRWAEEIHRFYGQPPYWEEREGNQH